MALMIDIEYLLGDPLLKLNRFIHSQGKITKKVDEKRFTESIDLNLMMRRIDTY